MAAPKLRILCLHDANSNASQLKSDLDLLGKRLYEKYGGIDLVYVNSPITVADNDAGRVWWEESHQQVENSPVYRGLDASLLLLQQIWTSSPFWGILGVGQGAAVAAFLTLMLPTLNETKPAASATIPPPHFAIFVRGQTLLTERERLIDNLPCLHLTRGELPQQELLLQQFGGTVHHLEGTCIFDKDALNAIGRFICLQKKQLLSSRTDQELVALQTVLHLTEQEAADKIAEHIAENPPGALMAVIRPQDVAGWSGNKRRQPGEEGGGAPCPSEFLLKRDKRPNAHSASRVHPNQTTRDQEECNG